MRRTLGTLSIFFAALLAAAAPAAAAEEHEFVRPHTGPLTPVPDAAPIRDVVLGTDDDAPKVARKAAFAPAVYPDGDGHSVSIQFSDSYPAKTAADAQALATFFGTFTHGVEMNGLRVVVLTRDEVDLACGAVVLACYDIVNQTMFVSGDGDEAGQAPNDFVMAHEYGHHLAKNNINPPFSGVFGASVPGPKYWASAAGVCPGIGTGYFSLDVNAGYYRFPGEVFAETFAHKRFPGTVPWQFETNPPTQLDFQAIDLDVRFPWTAQTRSKIRGRFKKKGKKVLQSKLIATPLDGSFQVRLKGPKKSNYDLFLLTPDRTGVYGESTKRKSKETVNTVICGERRIRATVGRFRGSGKYKLVVKKS